MPAACNAANLLSLWMPQALGPQVVQQLLIPHLEPFMSAVLVPAMSAAAEQDISAATPAHHHQQQLSWQRQVQQQQQQEAWQVYGAFVSAVGPAVYDLLIGHMRGRMPAQLVLQRPAGAPSSWQQEYTQTLLAVKRQAAQHRQQQRGLVDADGQQQQLQADCDTEMTNSLAGSSSAAAQQQGMAGSKAGLRGPPALMRGSGSHSGAAAATGSSHSEAQPSVAEVLGRSWKEDSDVNATLGALLSLFGEDLLPCLPLPQLAAVSL
jgi:hypothetical protein